MQAGAPHEASPLAGLIIKTLTIARHANGGRITASAASHNAGFSAHLQSRIVEPAISYLNLYKNSMNLSGTMASTDFDLPSCRGFSGLVSRKMVRPPSLELGTPGLGNR
jgi:hypothetical protein